MTFQAVYSFRYSFSKGLGAGSFGWPYAMLALMALACLAGARLLLRKQEA